MYWERANAGQNGKEEWSILRRKSDKERYVKLKRVRKDRHINLDRDSELDASLDLSWANPSPPNRRPASPSVPYHHLQLLQCLLTPGPFM